MTQPKNSTSSTKRSPRTNAADIAAAVLLRGQVTVSIPGDCGEADRAKEIDRVFGVILQMNPHDFLKEHEGWFYFMRNAYEWRRLCRERQDEYLLLSGLIVFPPWPVLSQKFNRRSGGASASQKPLGTSR